VTDRRTDGRTDGIAMAIARAEMCDNVRSKSWRLLQLARHQSLKVNETSGQGVILRLLHRIPSPLLLYGIAGKFPHTSPPTSRRESPPHTGP